MDKGYFEVKKLETGFLVRVCPPQPKENMYNNSPMQYVQPKEGAVSSSGEVLELMAAWLEKGDVEFKQPQTKPAPRDMYGQEPKIFPAINAGAAHDPTKVLSNG